MQHNYHYYKYRFCICNNNNGNTTFCVDLHGALTEIDQKSGTSHLC